MATTEEQIDWDALTAEQMLDRIRERTKDIVDSMCSVVGPHRNDVLRFMGATLDSYVPWLLELSGRIPLQMGLWSTSEPATRTLSRQDFS